MNRREMLLALACTGLSLRSLQAADNWLITPEEYEQELKKRALPGMAGESAEETYWKALPKSGPGAPQIVVRSPNVAEILTGPLKIDVAFIPAAGATIDLDTFKARYGILGIDVTDRIRSHATLTTSGITGELLRMPKGKHSFEIQISDDLKRAARQRIRCEIG